MKVRRYLPILFCLIATLTQASDPFDRRQRQTGAPMDTAIATSLCRRDVATLAPKTPINQLKIIGVIIQSEQAKVLFSSSDQMVISASKGDNIGQEKMQIAQISTHQIQLLNWQNSVDCRQAETVLLKF
ncbi:pilus assembly protein PilP [Actinobacillus seminis]|uniref:pilus assembly protein PilP n=1 Tax=Actinobacillus seminis TaxID=722 RepID=UPI003B93FCD5